MQTWSANDVRGFELLGFRSESRGPVSRLLLQLAMN